MRRSGRRDPDLPEHSIICQLPDIRGHCETSGEFSLLGLNGTRFCCTFLWMPGSRKSFGVNTLSGGIFGLPVGTPPFRSQHLIIIAARFSTEFGSDPFYQSPQFEMIDCVLNLTLRHQCQFRKRSQNLYCVPLNGPMWRGSIEFLKAKDNKCTF